MDDFKSTVSLLRRWNGQSIQANYKSEGKRNTGSNIKTKECFTKSISGRIKKERKDVKGYGF